MIMLSERPSICEIPLALRQGRIRVKVASRPREVCPRPRAPQRPIVPANGAVRAESDDSGRRGIERLVSRSD
jgi:hypothetical protein